MQLTTDRFAAWLSHFEQVEGRVDHMYLDGVGVVTIGIGCVVHDPMEFQMYRRQDGFLAVRAEIFSDYNSVKALPAGKTADYYGKVCRLYLPNRFIDDLFKNRLNAFVDSVEASICKLDSYPDAAALAIVDMAFNLGLSGLKQKFPKFVNAFVAKDWHVCALECRRNGIQAERNAWTRKQFEDLEA
jgi:GH24 family phage-related lysozyme (muramidase)